ncbi:hypothetical protein I4U23_027619 [Adineta vaga]|nr:hypothetical protein I4U23_027619 [Adineta vaga]
MSSNNSTVFVIATTSSNTVVNILNLISTRFVNYLPLVFVILGFIGFIGNSITFLQPTLSKNTCCIYTLSSSFIDVCNLFINLLPNYVSRYDISWDSWQFSRIPCKLKLFSIVFLPQLSINLLLLSLIDRFASTSDLASPIRRIFQRNMVPYLIILTIIISGIMSLHSPILNDLIPFYGCSSTNPLVSSVLYITFHGIVTPIVMLIFILLTYRNVVRSRQRVGMIATRNPNQSRNRFVGMIFVQIFGTTFFCLQWLMSHRFRKTFIQGVIKAVTCGQYRQRIQTGFIRKVTTKGSDNSSNSGSSEHHGGAGSSSQTSGAFGGSDTYSQSSGGHGASGNSSGGYEDSSKNQDNRRTKASVGGKDGGSKAGQGTDSVNNSAKNTTDKTKKSS